MRNIVLASGSAYRRELLARLGLPFDYAAPDIDETAHPGETARALTERLSLSKARALAKRFPDHLIIGSDQVLTLDGQPVSKPGDHTRAREQLRRCSGRSVEFITGLCLLDSATGRYQLTSEPFTVIFRELADSTIERYLERERPYDCAGSFRMEGLGISLFQALRGDDPNSLIGLPLIRLCSMLANEGVTIP
jgi:septum formation protein